MPDDERDEVGERSSSLMRGAAELDVPLEVNVAWGDTWASAKSLKPQSHGGERSLVRARCRAPGRGLPAVLVHEGHARRRSTTWSTQLGLDAGHAGARRRVRARAPRACELAGRGIVVHGVDISQRFVELARADAPRRRHVRAARRPDAAVRRRVRRRDLPLSGRVRPDDGRRATTTTRGGRHRPRAACRAGGWRSTAFNAYFVVKHCEDADVRRRDRASPTSAPRSATRRARRSRPICGPAATRRASCAAPAAATASRVDCDQQRRARRLRLDAADRRVARVPAAGDPNPLTAQPPCRLLHAIVAGSMPTALSRLRPRLRSDRPASSPSVHFRKQSVPCPTPHHTARLELRMGTFDEEGNYTPREVVADDLGM